MNYYTHKSFIFVFPVLFVLRDNDEAYEKDCDVMPRSADISNFGKEEERPRSMELLRRRAMSFS